MSRATIYFKQKESKMSFLPALRKEIKALAKMFSVPDYQAFALWFAKLALDLDDDDAFDALSVEGPNEKGMDLFWVDHTNQRVFIAQCKYSVKGTHRPKVKDLESLLSCTDWLVSPGVLDREGRSELVAAARDFQEAIERDYSVQLWFAYCGKRDENIDKRVRAFKANPENEQQRRTAIHCDLDVLQSMYEEYRGEGRRIETATIQMHTSGGEVEGSFGKGLLTSITAHELISLYENFGDQLFARNVRSWLGARKGSVNAGIIDTVENDRERGNFWAYNNGITIVCDRYDYDPNTRRLKLFDFSIVNGCQTTVALARSKDSAMTDEVFLLARIICPPESIIDSVIRYTNSQNLIRRWDLVSQDRTQRRLKRDFNSLSEPVYYMIRRGDWRSMNKEEKRQFRAEGGGFRIVKHDLLAQYLASFNGMAVVAYVNKAFLFDRFYEQTFPPDIRVEEALFVWRAGECTQALVREDIRKESERVQNEEKHREKYVLLKRGGRFYALGVLGLVTKLRNGRDFLQAITETRITSNRATERIDKYATISIQWYKQAVDDLLHITGTDLSVLIREKDFFDRVAERITNTYAAMSVNEEWLAGALPKLY